jgi:DNA polymerase sigma
MIGLYLKHWVKINKINGAADNYLSSYALLLMLIHFLQKVVEPRVLPNLQNVENRDIIYEYSQNGEILRTNTYFEEDVQKIKGYMYKINNGKENRDSPVTLLVKFLEYYSYYFDNNEQKISIHKPLEEDIKKNTDNI